MGQVLEACSLPIYTIQEVKQHNTTQSCWIIAHGYVYDVTTFLGSHPGGTRCILNHADGRDCSVDYDFHRTPGKEVWQKHLIGRLSPEETEQLLKKR